MRDHHSAASDARPIAMLGFSRLRIDRFQFWSFVRHSERRRLVGEVPHRRCLNRPREDASRHRKRSDFRSVRDHESLPSLSSGSVHEWLEGPSVICRDQTIRRERLHVVCRIVSNDCTRREFEKNAGDELGGAFKRRTQRIEHSRVSKQCQPPDHHGHESG
jgi:hypothetical protein